MASTSARHREGTPPGFFKNRRTATAWTLPILQNTRVILSTPYGTRLQSELVPLARAMFEFDIKIINRIERLDLKEQKHASSTGEMPNIETSNRLEVIKELKRQWMDIRNHRSYFSPSYLTDGQFIEFWEKDIKRIRVVLASKDTSGNNVQIRKDYQKVVFDYNDSAYSLYDTICDVAGEIAIENCILELIQERWMRRDRLFDRHLRVSLGDKQMNCSNPRTAPTWSHVHRTMREKIPRISKQIQHEKKIENGSRFAGGFNLWERIIDSTFVFWSVLAGCIFTSLAFCACGYAQSSHARGSTKDAEFWFLLQSSTTQVIGLGVSAFIEWKNRNHPQWYWIIPRGIAGLCAFVAIPLYIAAPTEWSSFLSQSAGLTQTFMICQHLISRTAS